VITFFQYLLYTIAILSAALWIYYSIKSRRADNAKTHGILTARMNMAMGSMLISIASVQLFMFLDSWVRLTVGTLFLLLGCFNLFAGIRNHAYFNRLNQ
jgi:uncharacterized membrane protein